VPRILVTGVLEADGAVVTRWSHQIRDGEFSTGMAEGVGGAIGHPVEEVAVRIQGEACRGVARLHLITTELEEVTTDAIAEVS